MIDIKIDLKSYDEEGWYNMTIRNHPEFMHKVAFETDGKEYVFNINEVFNALMAIKTLNS